MKKSIIILLLYDSLQSRDGVNLPSFIKEQNISLSTFRRYISDINYYLIECYSGRSVKYYNVEKKYRLEPELCEIFRENSTNSVSDTPE